MRLAYIGGIAWQKGIHVVLDALQGLEEKVELWIAGDESYDPAYTRRLRALATPNVRFLGLLAHTQVWETLAQTDAVVVPSLWYETYSLITHEAFAAHVAVIASRLGALEEAVRDGIDGLLVPPGDVAAWRAAIVRLVDQPGLLATMRANTRPPMTEAEHVSRIESLYLAARSLRQTGGDWPSRVGAGRGQSR
jgi:glycosyltransferase involved in cell wall biosynthesis